MLDILIKGALIVDGAGNPGYYGDLAVDGGPGTTVNNALIDNNTFTNDLAHPNIAAPAIIHLDASPNALIDNNIF